MGEQWLTIRDPAELARAIKLRLSGESRARPGRDEWTLTDAVFSAAERAMDGPERDCMAAAVIMLLKELVDAPAARRVTLEWPAGLFYVAGRVAWKPEELNAMATLVQSLAEGAAKWPIGSDFEPGLNSPRLEFLRLARFVKVTDEHIRQLLERSITELQRQRRVTISVVSAREQDQEFGALLGLWASWGFTEQALAFFLTLQDETRDRVFRAFVQEVERWEEKATRVQEALLRYVDRNSFPIHVSLPSYRDQRWAAEAAQWIGKPRSDYVRRTIERLTAVPSSDKPPKMTKAPSFARGSANI